ncbi:MAG: oligopeptide transporter, OPT family [Candidatus Binataceae bacterium]|nr:oligopeptide transporter, OPT family [Candidatus Binataceae bacterium]
MPPSASEPSPSPAGAEIRELTPRAFVLGAILALILGAANAYLGLYAGLTVSASIPAAVISMAVLRALGRATILENNVVQTIASAGEAVAAGAIFTFPAIVILGYTGPLPYWDVTLLCLAGGTMGSLLVAFLRRAYIVEERLPFPEGLACAEVLRAGASNEASAAPLAWGGAIAAALKAAQDIFGWIPGTIAGARWIGSAAVAGSFNVSAALLGVGYIVGPAIAGLVFAGGAFAWLVAIPIVATRRPELRALPPATAALQIWGTQTRYLGVGAMLVGGAATLWRLRGAIANGLAESARMFRAPAGAAVRREDRDLAARTVITAVALCIPVIFLLCYRLSGRLWLSLALAIALVAIGFFATAIAGYLTGIVGASNNPVSGVTIIVLLAIAIILEALGVDAKVGPRLAIMAGAVVCTAAAMAGDSLHDLATGYHVGATPRSLEIAVLFGAALSAFVMAPVLNLLIRGYGIAGTPTAHAQALAAPQAFLMAKVALGVFRGGLPIGTIAAGAAIAAGLAACDARLRRRGARWSTPVMPVAIGLYLPFGLSVAMFAGALLRARRESADDRTGGGAGILFAAGLVAGEALMGVAGGALVTLGIKLPLF